MDHGEFGFHADDLLIGMAGALEDLARPVMAEVVFGGQHDASVPATV